MKRMIPLLLSLLLLTGYGGNTSDTSYQQITQKAAKDDGQPGGHHPGCTGELDEYGNGHISGAVLAGRYH